MSKYRWREIERELIRFFQSEGLEVEFNGDHWVEIPGKEKWLSATAISLTKLAHMLAESW
jgi:hypothetical protein